MAGRIRVKMSSLIMATTSSSSSLISMSLESSYSSLITGAPVVKCSVKIRKISGFITAHWLSLASFSMVMKLDPNITDLMPSTEKSFTAKGLRAASLPLKNSNVSFSFKIDIEGRNLRACSLGVSAVWMNKLRTKSARRDRAARSPLKKRPDIPLNMLSISIVISQRSGTMSSPRCTHRVQYLYQSTNYLHQYTHSSNKIFSNIET
ncbi:hypothetical protein PGUG_00998, partial [Meyerozyma guilliermondii ATCC 6260]